MHRRLLPPLVAPLAAVIFFSGWAGGSAPALAAVVDEPVTLVFEGVRTGVALGGEGFEGTPYGPDESRTEWECIDGTCRLAAINGRAPVAEYAAWTFTDGVGSWSTPLSGNGCDDTAERATNGTATLDGETLTVFVRYEPTPVFDCGGGSTIQTFANEHTYVLELVAGEVCILDRSCAVDAPEPAATATAPVSGPREFVEPTVFGDLDTVVTAARPANLLWAAVGTIILALLIAIPTHLFNTATEALSDRIGAWWRRLRNRAEPSERPGVALAGWPLAAGGVAVAAVIAAFADPAFALDAAGVRVLLSILVSFGIEVVLGWVAVILIVRRTHPAAAATVRFAPLSLLVVAGAVLLTRLTAFEPPIVFGLVAGVAFGGLLGTADKARVALIGLGWSFGVGFVSWLVYSLLPGDAVVARELLATAAIAGLSTVPIALLPLRGLAGRTVWEANRRVWLVAYAIGLFAFLLVLLPLPASWAEVGFGVWAWAGLYLLYALGALAVWAAVVRPWRAEAAEADV